MNQSINNEHGKVVNAGEVRFVRILPGPIERAWEYLTVPEKRAQWFCGGTSSLEVGGKMTLEFHNKQLSGSEAVPEKYASHAKAGIRSEVIVTRCDPPRSYGFDWDNGEVLFDLVEKGDKVQLTLTHRNLPNRKEMLDVSGGWHIHLTVLVAKLEGSPQPPFWGTLERLEGEYERLFPPGA